MYCDTYCKGRSSPVDCANVSGDEKEKCIKSCLDCRSPNKKFCYCPTIFPPPTNARSGLGGRSMHDRNFQLFSEDDNVLEADDDEIEMSTAEAFARVAKGEDPQEEQKSEIGIIVAITITILIIAIAVGVFCAMRYNRRKKDFAPGPMSTQTTTMTMQQPQMQQGGRGGSGPRPQSNRYENSSRQRGPPTETEESDDY